MRRHTPRLEGPLAVEGYTPLNPVSDEDYEDEIAWLMRNFWYDRSQHDQDGFLAQDAGSPACLALGHKPVLVDGFGYEDWGDDHAGSFDGEWLCKALTTDTCCTYCEGECQLEIPLRKDFLWSLVGADA